MCWKLTEHSSSPVKFQLFQENTTDSRLQAWFLLLTSHWPLQRRWELHTQDQDPRDSGYPTRARVPYWKSGPPRRAAHTGPGSSWQWLPPRARVPYWKSGPPRRRTFEPEGFFQQGRKGLVTSTQKLRQTQMRKRAERSEITGNL